MAWVTRSNGRPPASALLPLLLVMSGPCAGQPDGLIPSGRVELARLLDLASARTGVVVSYGDEVRGTVTLRTTEPLGDGELWRVVNDALGVRGLTTVHVSADAALTVVPLRDAARLARLDGEAAGGDRWPPEEGARAGFARVATGVRHVRVARAAAALAPVLSEVGSAVALGDGAVVIADRTPRVEQALELLRSIDVEAASPVVEVVTPAHVAPEFVLGQLADAAESVPALSGRAILSPDGRSVLVVAPASAQAGWRDLVLRYDVPQAVETRAYSARGLGSADLARLVRQETEIGGARAPTRIEERGSSVIVAAAPAQHDRIAALIDRLQATPVEARSETRMFVVRNRDAGELVGVLQTILGAGGMPSGQFMQRMDLRERGSIRRPGEPLELAPYPAQEQAQPLEGDDVGVEAQPVLPSLTLTSDAGTNTLIASGEPRLLDQIASLLPTLDVRQPQVMLEIMLISLSESQGRDLGIELEALDLGGDTMWRLSSLFGLAGSGGAAAATGAGLTGVVLNPGDFSVLVRALETVNEGRSLSMPKLLVNNNEQAVFDAVRQEPFASINASNTVATTTLGGTSDAGTRVTIVPRIAEGDHLVLEYSVELSAFVGESVSEGLPPPRQQNSVDSVATIPDGFTVVVGGIESLTEAEAETRVPLIGSVPLVGELFKSRSKSMSRARFFVFIRANVMRRDGFEDLKYVSQRDLEAVELDDGWPEVRPAIMR